VVTPHRTDPGQPETVRLRIAGGEYIRVKSYRAAVPAPLPQPAAATPHRDEAAAVRLPEPSPSTGKHAGQRPVLVLIEAVPSGAEELAATALEVMAAGGRTCGVVSLDPHNRLAARHGCTTLSPGWCWRQAAPELLVQRGDRIVVTAPAHEAELEGGHVEAVLGEVLARADALVVDLGCRWVPRLFRPVVGMATQIWLVTRTGQWTGAEMRIEQAEISGWTPMDRVRLLVLGPERPPLSLGVGVAGAVPDWRGPAAWELAVRELGRA